MNHRLFTAQPSIRQSIKKIHINSNIPRDESNSNCSLLKEGVKFDNLEVKRKLLRTQGNLRVFDDVNNYLYIRKANMHFKSKSNKKGNNLNVSFSNPNGYRRAISSQGSKRYRAHFIKKSNESEGFCIQVNVK